MERIFSNYDHDGNGVLDSAELEQFWADVLSEVEYPAGTPQVRVRGGADMSTTPHHARHNTSKR